MNCIVSSLKMGQTNSFGELTCILIFLPQVTLLTAWSFAVVTQQALTLGTVHCVTTLRQLNSGTGIQWLWVQIHVFNNKLLYVSSSGGGGGDGGGNGDDDRICNRSRSQGRGRGRSSSRSSHGNSSNSSSSSSRSCKIMIRQYRTALYNTVKYSWSARTMS